MEYTQYSIDTQNKRKEKECIKNQKITKSTKYQLQKNNKTKQKKRTEKEKNTMLLRKIHANKYQNKNK